MQTDGVNFAVVQPACDGCVAAPLRGAGGREPLQVIDLDPATTGLLLLARVRGRRARGLALYTWRVDGPGRPVTGFASIRGASCSIPGRGWCDAAWKREAAIAAPSTACEPKSSRADDYDWEGDAPLKHPLEDTVIYELHVGGFTCHLPPA